MAIHATPRRKAPVAAPPAPWRNRIVGNGEEAPDQLLANPGNWRIHPAAQQGALASVLDDVGWVKRVLVNRRTGHIVDGHLRVELALSRQEPSVPVAYVDLSEAEEAPVLASLDPLSAMAVADPAKLRELLDGVTISNDDLMAMLAEIMPKDPAGKTDPDDVPEVPVEPYVKPGELWLLGDHRLLCGDAQDPKAWHRLLDGARLDCVWTDPPYGVDVVGGGRQYSKEARRTAGGLTIAGDTVDSLAELLGSAFQHLVDALRPGGAAYIAHPQGPLAALSLAALGALPFHLSTTLVWVKNSLVLSRQDYHNRHEPIYYGWREGAAHAWYSDRKQSSVFEVDRPSRSELHPTMKPVALVSAMLANSTREGDRVGDPFAGSGTTIIAAEQAGLRCYALELDPKYAQVAIERWQAFTGQRATRG